MWSCGPAKGFAYLALAFHVKIFQILYVGSDLVMTMSRKRIPYYDKSLQKSTLC